MNTPSKTLGAGSIAAIATSALGAAAAWWNHRRASEAERVTPPIGAFIETETARLHYLEKGEGPPLVLLHGNGAMIQDWQIAGIFDDLAKDHRVIAFDRPGFGHSPRPRTTAWTPAHQAKAIAEAMDALGTGPAVIVGHSLGSLVAAQLALDHPEKVSRVVLISGYYYPNFRIDALLNAPTALPVIGDIMRHTVSPLIARAMKPAVYRTLFAPAPVKPEWKAAFPEELALRPFQLQGFAADGAMMVPAAAEASRRYDELTMPLTIVVGAGDSFISPDDQSLRLHEALPHSRLVSIEGAGHMVHQTASAQVIEAIRT